MFCMKCGNQLAENAAFCSMCGEKTSGTQEQMIAVEAQPTQPMSSAASPMPTKEFKMIAEEQKTARAPAC